MRPVRVVVSAVGVSPVIPIDQYSSTTNIGLGIIVTTGPAVYTVQHTFDDVFAVTFDPLTANWFDHPTLINQTVNRDSNYAAPPRGVRLNVTTLAAGNVALMLIQAGSPSTG
jgi:hypothetical protein